MKIYRFKIQWIFNICFNQEIKDMFTMLKIIDPRNLTRISFLDNDFKSVENYTDMVMHSSENAYSAFRKYWNKLKKTDDFKKIRYVEFYRNS